jgi:hypothetical protein
MSHQDTKAQRMLLYEVAPLRSTINQEGIFSNKKHLVPWCLGGNNQSGG